MILAHPQMSAEQACNFAREHGMLLVHTARGNYIYQPVPAQSPVHRVAAVAGPAPVLPLAVASDSPRKSMHKWTERRVEREPDPEIDDDLHDFRDYGDPLEKRYPANDWRSWEQNQPEHTPGLGKR